MYNAFDYNDDPAAAATTHMTPFFNISKVRRHKSSPSPLSVSERK